MEICGDSPTYGWVHGLVGGWVNGWGQVKSLKIELIKIIQFCLKIYDLLRHPHLWLGVWVDGWVNMWVNGDNMGTT